MLGFIVFILEEFEEVKKCIELIEEKKKKLEAEEIQDCIDLLEDCLEIYKGKFTKYEENFIYLIYRALVLLKNRK